MALYIMKFKYLYLHLLWFLCSQYPVNMESLLHLSQLNILLVKYQDLEKTNSKKGTSLKATGIRQMFYSP